MRLIYFKFWWVISLGFLIQARYCKFSPGLLIEIHWVWKSVLWRLCFPESTISVLKHPRNCSKDFRGLCSNMVYSKGALIKVCTHVQIHHLVLLGPHCSKRLYCSLIFFNLCFLFSSTWYIVFFVLVLYWVTILGRWKVAWRLSRLPRTCEPLRNRRRTLIGMHLVLIRLIEWLNTISCVSVVLAEFTILILVMVELTGKWSFIRLSLWCPHSYLHTFSLLNFSILFYRHRRCYMLAVWAVFGVWIGTLGLCSWLHLKTILEVFYEFLIKLLFLFSPKHWLACTRVLGFYGLLGLNFLLDKSLQILNAISSTLLNQSILWGKLLARWWISDVLMAACYTHGLSVAVVAWSVRSFSSNLASLFILRSVSSLRIIRNLIMIQVNDWWSIFLRASTVLCVPNFQIQRRVLGHWLY